MSDREDCDKEDCIMSKGSRRWQRWSLADASMHDDDLAMMVALNGYSSGHTMPGLLLSEFFLAENTMFYYRTTTTTE